MPEQRCKSCGEEIIWCKTEKGKPMPVDMAPDAGGNLIILPDGTVAVLKGNDLAIWRTKKGYALHTSHFATCPNAAKHRKKKGTNETQS